MARTPCADPAPIALTVHSVCGGSGAVPCWRVIPLRRFALVGDNPVAAYTFIADWTLTRGDICTCKQIILKAGASVSPLGAAAAVPSVMSSMGQAVVFLSSTPVSPASCTRATTTSTSNRRFLPRLRRPPWTNCALTIALLTSVPSTIFVESIVPDLKDIHPYRVSTMVWTTKNPHRVEQLRYLVRRLRGVKSAVLHPARFAAADNLSSSSPFPVQLRANV